MLHLLSNSHGLIRFLQVMITNFGIMVPNKVSHPPASNMLKNVCQPKRL